MKKTLFIAFLFLTSLSFGQDGQRYEDEKGTSHLCGEFPIETLKSDEVFQEWFVKNYADFPKTEKQKWAKKLKDVQVDIYLGTWCGDSKRWVPRFVKIWDDLGLKKEQLKFIAFYGSGDTYKQSPNGEEKGKGIHRVPTFIFKRKDIEIARIVETPNNSLETDLKQIALDCPSKPNYRVANFLMNDFKGKTTEEIKLNLSEYYNEAYSNSKSSKELNTVGYVLLAADKVQEALIVFQINTYLFEHEPNVYDSYAEALVEAGEIEKAKENYQKILLLDRSNKGAREKLNELYSKK